MKKKLKLIFLISLPVLIISLFIAEMLFRLWWNDKPLGYPGAPETGWFKKFVHPNSLGYRGKIPLGAKQPGTFRIVVLGDSITFGKGIEREENRYPELLGRLLEKSTGAKIEVVNLGFPARNTAGEYRSLQVVGMKFEPDVVIIGYGYNDPETLDQILNVFRKTNPGKIKRWLFGNSYIASVINASIEKEGVESFYINYYHSINAPDAPNIAQFRESLKGIVELSRSSGADVAAVIFPIFMFLDKTPYEFQDADDLITSELKTLEAPYADLLPLFKGRNGRNYWVSSYDSHPNEEVHETAAKELFKIVEPLITKRKLGGAKKINP